MFNEIQPTSNWKDIQISCNFLFDVFKTTSHRGEYIQSMHNTVNQGLILHSVILHFTNSSNRWGNMSYFLTNNLSIFVFKKNTVVPVPTTIPNNPTTFFSFHEKHIRTTLSSSRNYAWRYDSRFFIESTKPRSDRTSRNVCAVHGAHDAPIHLCRREWDVYNCEGFLITRSREPKQKKKRETSRQDELIFPSRRQECLFFPLIFLRRNVGARLVHNKIADCAVNRATTE